MGGGTGACAPLFYLRRGGTEAGTLSKTKKENEKMKRRKRRKRKKERKKGEKGERRKIGEKNVII